MNHDYVAGLFDGEGCFVITISKNAGKVRRQEFYYKAEAAIEIREEFLVDLLISLYGGNKTKKLPRKEGHSTTYRWKINGENLKAFCQHMDGRFLLKAEQSKVILEFFKVGEGKTTTALTDDQIAKQLHLRCVIMNLNKKGVSHG
ncbi:hypothetical protein vB_PsyM_KIL4_0125 [Pseudomonas phage vB_PsyM_KIL4]|uniref:Homing endonuclease LAGLIDADG domain-containing protein n=1 Tax=Pseudomonas phage vB_PsyM_KIL4 TaxID=1777069 RepID=A0A142IF44_9CAUD|nr:HNH endonuclease [Pseudomonas phage vB_PsyM_KIL4]AMR57849.1 hypothetical protein vB_PsyM_KIL4_0125 [Pseudomonas phage vB_PsyM_KIL4]